MSEPLVIVGNGMAATRLVEEITRLACGKYAILVVGAEPQLAYNRVLLSSLLAREIDAADLELKNRDWWRKAGVTLVTGKAVTGIDRAAKTASLESGHDVRYGKLVLATGSQPIRPPIPGLDLPGVLTFRTRADVDAMWEEAGSGRRVTVIGGGLLGLEAAHGLNRAGAEVTLVHLMDRLMERQLDPRAAKLLLDEVRARGVRVELNADTARVTGTDRATGLDLKDGRHIPADLVVAAIGIRANADLARAAGLTVARGIVVDDVMTTSDPSVFALGECAEHRGQTYGLVEPAYDQAKVLARHLAGKSAGYAGSVLATNLKVSGVSVFSAGDFMGGEGAQDIVLSDPALKTYKKLVIRDGRLTGAVLYGDTADGLWYLDLIRKGQAVEPIRETLIFGRALSETLPHREAAE
jgi:nitrite reductase (NADH) large subunit